MPDTAAGRAQSAALGMRTPAYDNVNIGGHPFSPLDIPACSAWFDFSNTQSMALSGANIMAITNIANGGHILVPQGGTPTLIPLARNGQSVGKFSSASSQSLQGGTPTLNPFHPSDEAYYVVVCNISSAISADGGIFSVTDNVGNEKFWLLQQEPSHTLLTRHYNAANGNASTGAILTADDNWHILGAQFTPLGDTTETLKLYRDGTQQIAAANVTGSPRVGSLAHIGHRGTGVAPFEGQIAEICCYYSTPTAGQRAQLLNYLSKKWVITLTGSL